MRFIIFKALVIIICFSAFVILMFLPILIERYKERKEEKRHKKAYYANTELFSLCTLYRDTQKRWVEIRAYGMELRGKIEALTNELICLNPVSETYRKVIKEIEDIKVQYTLNFAHDKKISSDFEKVDLDLQKMCKDLGLSKNLILRYGLILQNMI